MNLLTDPLITVDSGDMLSLPALFAASARGEVPGFRRLRAHQRTAWHMFRVQLAALALQAGGLSEPLVDAHAWAALLRALTPELGDDPWCLVVEDRTRPAFLQPPDPGGLKWEPVRTPDELDLLITARNHDLKRAVASTATADDCIFALVTLQTSEGYGGSGNYGIARMNGGSSSRPFLGLAPVGERTTPDPSAWWRRDVGVLLRNPSPFLTPGGPSLLWCLHWAETDILAAQDMDPWAIEVCRRIRLVKGGPLIVAQRAGSKAARTAAASFKGALGDAWAPLSLKGKEPVTLTLGEGRFDYRRMRDLFLSGNWDVPLAARIQDDEDASELVLIAEALSRGNSKTWGLKSRTIPLPRRARGLLRTGGKILADTAAEMIAGNLICRCSVA